MVGPFTMSCMLGVGASNGMTHQNVTPPFALQRHLALCWPMNWSHHFSWPGAPLALLSALLFGASTPFAKLLLGQGLNPWLLAGLLYGGSGVGLFLWQIVRGVISDRPSEASLQHADLPWLALIILSGGVAGPLFLMFGLQSTAASTASLLLNLEGLATMTIAWTVFRENADRRIVIGALSILAGAIVLSWSGGRHALGLGAVLIVGACVAWGVDNNLTRKISASDPVQIAAIKGVIAGAVNFGLALASGAALPTWSFALCAGLVGFFGYGVSLVLFVLALRYLGAARTGAYFSMASFIGAALAITMLTEPITIQVLAAALLMGIGLWLHLTERHEHEHRHEALEHEHRHTHDVHHEHAHGPSDPPGEPHMHRHKHTPLVHAHPHYPDLHHRHGHS